MEALPRYGYEYSSGAAPNPLYTCYMSPSSVSPTRNTAKNPSETAQMKIPRFAATTQYLAIIVSQS